MKDDKSKRTIERSVADAILERPGEVIEIGGDRYEIAPPTVATLIMVSELIGDMPIVNKGSDNGLVEVLATAQDMTVVGKIVAVLILGAKRVMEHRYKIVSKRRLWSWKRFRFEYEEQSTEEVEWLGARLLEELSAKQVVEIVSKKLVMLGISDFFALTTSLSEANLLRKTREVETQCGGKLSVGPRT